MPVPVKWGCIICGPSLLSGVCQSSPFTRTQLRLFLIEHVQLLVAELREFGAPAGATADGLVVLNRADHPDFLSAVH